LPTQNEPLNTFPIQQFINKVKSADHSKSKQVMLDISEAKALAFALGATMARLEGDLEKLVAESKSTDNEIIQVNVDAGSKW
jgi:hypothetical protein